MGEFNAVIMEKIKVAVGMSVSRSALQSMRLERRETAEDLISGHLAYTLQMYLAAGERRDVHEVELVPHGRLAHLAHALLPHAWLQWLPPLKNRVIAKCTSIVHVHPAAELPAFDLELRGAPVGRPPSSAS
jgi:hypothetical protein